MEKNKRKIFIIQREFIPSKGGDSRRIDELANMLGERYDVKIVSTSFSEDKSPLGNKIIRINSNPYTILSRWYFCLRVLLRFFKERPSAIYINAPFLEASLIVLFCRVLKVKSIINMTLMGQDGPIDLYKRTKYPKILAKLFLWLLGKADYILALGSGLAKQAVEYGWDKEKVNILGPAKDPVIYHPPSSIEEKRQLREKYGFKEDELLFIFVGYLIPRKGFEDLVSVWKDIWQQIEGGKLIIVGGKYEGFEEWAEEHLNKLDKGSFKYLDALSREEVGEALRMADVFVFPTYSEGIPGAVVETMMTGLPIISTNLKGSIADLIKDGENGILVEPGDKKALQEAILTVYKDKSIREKLGKKALESSYEFHIDNIKNKYLEIFS